jgi:DNA-binding transcriptional ArsR family regulator
MPKLKTPKQMERHLKGIANHYRIEILLIIAKNKEISLDEIIEKTKANPKTIGEHTRRLFVAGLITKTKNGNYVLHSLSPYGKKFVTFLKSFQNLSLNT